MNRKHLCLKSLAGFFLCVLCLLPFPSGAQSMSLILTSDQQLNDLMDPDKKIDASLGYNPYIVKGLLTLEVLSWPIILTFHISKTAAQS